MLKEKHRTRRIRKKKDKLLLLENRIQTRARKTWISVFETAPPVEEAVLFFLCSQPEDLDLIKRANCKGFNLVLEKKQNLLWKPIFLNEWPAFNVHLGVEVDYKSLYKSRARKTGQGSFGVPHMAPKTNWSEMGFVAIEDCHAPLLGGKRPVEAWESRDRRDFKDFEFEFRCPMRWEMLKETDNPNKRFCGKCKKHVHLMKTEEQRKKLAEEGKCIAVDVYVNQRKKQEVRRFMGAMRAR